MAVLIPLFMWSDIKRGVHKVQKRLAARQAAMEIKAGRIPPPVKHHKKHHRRG